MGLLRTRAVALVVASHPAPSVGVTAIAFVLTARAGSHPAALVIIALAILAGQLSVGWSNDAIDAGRDAATGRPGKPVATGVLPRRLIWTAAITALAVALALPLAVSPVTALVSAGTLVAAWAYNAGLKATWASWVPYAVAFGLLPAIATTALPGHPWPRWWIMVIAGTLGAGAHFANVLPDLDADRETGVRGLPQGVAERWGPWAVRAAAVALLLAASVALVIAARSARRGLASGLLVAAIVLALICLRARDRVPFLAAIGVAAVDVALLAAGGESLS